MKEVSLFGCGSGENDQVSSWERMTSKGVVKLGFCAIEEGIQVYQRTQGRVPKELRTTDRCALSKMSLCMSKLRRQGTAPVSNKHLKNSNKRKEGSCQHVYGNLHWGGWVGLTVVQVKIKKETIVKKEGFTDLPGKKGETST